MTFKTMMATPSQTASMCATVGRLSADAAVQTDDRSRPWRGVPALTLDHHMGRRPDHFPRTSVKLAYTASAVHLRFRVADRYVRAIARRHQESVCGDSCVEFFFTPLAEASSAYFNLEINCGGTVLFHFHPAPAEEAAVIPIEDCAGIVTGHSLPSIVDPEIGAPVTWSVAAAIPLDLLQRYGPVDVPRPGAVWRANFYKCADRTSHPHWLTWSPVDYPKPNFHLPQAFGRLEFAR